MPIYEYHCKACGSDFELLVNKSTEPRCEQCGSGDIDKKFSTFAAKSEGASPSIGGGHAHGPGCGCCCGGPNAGSCGLN